MDQAWQLHQVLSKAIRKHIASTLRTVLELYQINERACKQIKRSNDELTFLLSFVFDCNCRHGFELELVMIDGNNDRNLIVIVVARVNENEMRILSFLFNETSAQSIVLYFIFGYLGKQDLSWIFTFKERIDYMKIFTSVIRS